GEMEGEYREAVSGLGVEDRVHFLGQRDDIPAIMSGLDLVVLPSLVEATPYVIVEAMAAGLPVIASDIYGIPEMVEGGETGILIPVGNSAALADAVWSLMNNHDLRERMGLAARKRYEAHFRIERSVSKTTEIYLELIGRQRNGG
ncbi:MAG: glycosyltransferase, partial [Candidatus Krumholzibacteria bacterium]|nr:glycosyltransferase [Candidatus Krumholzibacteria bacterium]